MALFARSDPVPLEPNQLKEFVAEYRSQQNFQVAIVALLVYDTFITLDKEAKYFWKVPRRPVDFIYFTNRYIGIFGAITSLFRKSNGYTQPVAELKLATLKSPRPPQPFHCNFSVWTRNAADWITILSIDYILMIRVLALYSQDKALSICLKTLLTLEAMFKLGMVIYLNILEHIAIGIFADISLCGHSGSTSWQLAVIDWLIPSLYGTLLMTLALYKAAEYWRLSSGFKGFTLVKVLIEDQIVYFLFAISCSVFSILEIRVVVSNEFLASVLTQLGNPVYLSLLGSRMLFNLKDAGERGQNEGTSYRTPSGTMSDMDFTEPVNPQRESGTEHSGSEQMA